MFIPHPACLVGRVLAIHAPQIVAAEVENGLPSLDHAVLQGRLKNSESLCKLDVLLGHLSESKQADLCEIIGSFPCLFGDTPTQIHLIYLYRHWRHTASKAVVYRVSPCLVLSCPCLMVPNSHNTQIL